MISVLAMPFVDGNALHTVETDDAHKRTRYCCTVVTCPYDSALSCFEVGNSLVIETSIVPVDRAIWLDQIMECA